MAKIKNYKPSVSATHITVTRKSNAMPMLRMQNGRMEFLPAQDANSVDHIHDAVNDLSEEDRRYPR